MTASRQEKASPFLSSGEGAARDGGRVCVRRGGEAQAKASFELLRTSLCLFVSGLRMR